MSQHAAFEFVRKLRTDPSLRARLVALQSGLADQSIAELSRKMVDLGVEAGFDITRDDLRDIYRAMVEQVNVNRELDDAELSAVVGGRHIFDGFIESFAATIAASS